MWWRSFFLQAAWSYPFKQNLGFATWYRKLRPESRISPARMLEPFNTNPVTSCFVVPFLASRETAEADEEGLLRARAFLASSFAATGDRLVWFLLRPIAGLAGAIAAWLSQSAWPGALGLLIAYNAPQVWLRVSLWNRGRSGAAPAGEVQRISRWAERARKAGLALVGFAAIAVPSRGGGFGPVGVGLLLACAVATAFITRLGPRKLTFWSLCLLGAAVALNQGMP